VGVGEGPWPGSQLPVERIKHFNSY
jgi:hypothetical protein